MKICPINAWAANGLFNLNRLGIYAVVYWDTGIQQIRVYLSMSMWHKSWTISPDHGMFMFLRQSKVTLLASSEKKRSFSLVLKYADVSIAWLHEINVTNITVNSNYRCINNALHQLYISGYILPVYYFVIRRLQRGGGGLNIFPRGLSYN